MRSGGSGNIMRKVISFCIFGNNPKYTQGAIENAIMAPHIYPDWECRFYVGNDVEQEVKDQLLKYNGVVIDRDSAGWDSTFWRFEPISDPTVDVFISRDTDSRLNYRERRAVDEWLSSGKPLHIMRDHPYHGYAVLAGMWGFRGTIEGDLTTLVQDYISKSGRNDYYQVDQDFLRDVIYANFKEMSCVHDEFFDKTKWPTERAPGEYVGSPWVDGKLEIPFVSK